MRLLTYDLNKYEVYQSHHASIERIWIILSLLSFFKLLLTVYFQDFDELPTDGTGIYGINRKEAQV